MTDDTPSERSYELPFAPVHPHPRQRMTNKLKLVYVLLKVKPNHPNTSWFPGNIHLFLVSIRLTSSIPSTLLLPDSAHCLVLVARFDAKDTAQEVWCHKNDTENLNFPVGKLSKISGQWAKCWQKLWIDDATSTTYTAVLKRGNYVAYQSNRGSQT